MLRTRSLALFLTLACLFATSLQAEELNYLDDRSSPQTLVASYFNALNRSEFVRAWGYWDNEIEGTNFEGFVEGFIGIVSHRFKLGESFSEGAAGSTFTQVPLAVMTLNKDGSGETYQGCFIVRIANPDIQSPPFLGHHFWEGNLKPVEESFEDVTLGECRF